MFSKTRRNSCTRASKNKNIRFYEADNLCKNVKTRFNDVVQQRPVRVGLTPSTGFAPLQSHSSIFLVCFKKIIILKKFNQSLVVIFQRTIRKMIKQLWCVCLQSDNYSACDCQIRDNRSSVLLTRLYLPYISQKRSWNIDLSKLVSILDSALWSESDPIQRLSVGQI